jgi:hypothetical protein
MLLPGKLYQVHSGAMRRLVLPRGLYRDMLELHVWGQLVRLWRVLSWLYLLQRAMGLFDMVCAVFRGLSPARSVHPLGDRR